MCSMESEVTIKELREIGYTLVCGMKGDHWMDVTVYEHTVCLPASNERIEYFIRDEDYEIESLTHDVTKATPYIEGFVKWDGCCQLRFKEDGSHPMHFDSLSDIDRFGLLFKEIWKVAEELLGGEFKS